MRVIEPENNTVRLSGPPLRLQPEKLDRDRTEEMLFMLDSWIDETDKRRFWVMGWAVIALRIFASAWKRASLAADEGDRPFEIIPTREEGRWIGGKIRWVFGDALLELGHLRRVVAVIDRRTVPWVDAMHKMGRQLTGYLGFGLAFYMVHKGGVDPMAIMASVAPGGIYAAFKNKGK